MRDDRVVTQTRNKPSREDASTETSGSMAGSNRPGPALEPWDDGFLAGRDSGDLVRGIPSNGVDQHEADDKHHRAGCAMDGERSRL
jgi:hypothetical protein